MRTNRHLLLLLLSAVVVACGFFLLNSFTQRTTASYSDTDPLFNAKYWAERISSAGAESAYAEFIAKNAQTSTQGQHLSAHVIGEKIFESEGVSGISVCDAHFAFGCYHGFFGKALSREGVGVIRRLDTACVQRFGPLGTGCQHGIGHGILEYTGYQKISSALDLCKGTTQEVPLLGCTSGVFMEYNSPLVGLGKGLAPTTRSLDEMDPYQPCDSISEEYKKSCYFELGGWATSIFSAELKKASEYCAQAPASYSKECSLGFGATLLPSMGYDYVKSRAICDVFSDENRIACRAGIAWALYADPAHRRETSTACEMEGGYDSTQCMILADLTEGKGNFPNE